MRARASSQSNLTAVSQFMSGAATATGSGSVPSPAGGAGSAPANSSGSHAMRRGGARREVTERVLMKPYPPSTAPGSPSPELEGWALNLSRGGLRCILEEKVALGGEYMVTLGDGEDFSDRRARVVWVQEEPDGVIVGLEFMGLSGLHVPQSAADKISPLARTGSNPIIMHNDGAGADGTSGAGAKGTGAGAGVGAGEPGPKSPDDTSEGPA